MKSNGRNMLAISIVVVLLLAIHFASPSPVGLWLRTLYNSLHVPVFGIIAICVFVITPAQWGRRNRLVAIIAVVIGLSVISEVAQIPINRDASFKDLVADWFGAAGFIAMGIVFSRSFSVPKGLGRYLVLLGMACILWPLLPLAKVSAAYVERVQMLPSLVRFDSRFADTFFRLQNAELVKQTNDILGAVSADILLRDGPWPGIAFNDLWPNWEPYAALNIEIENPQPDELSVNIRVHDGKYRAGEQRYNDRFNRRVDLAPGLQTIPIMLTDIRDAPAGRQMNMAEIDGLIIFATKQEAGKRFVLHEIRLD
jgi:VanZ family protein